jgi:hypothetical protein
MGFERGENDKGQKLSWRWQTPWRALNRGWALLMT